MAYTAGCILTFFNVRTTKVLVWMLYVTAMIVAIHASNLEYEEYHHIHLKNHWLRVRRQVPGNQGNTTSDNNTDVTPPVPTIRTPLPPVTTQPPTSPPPTTRLVTPTRPPGTTTTTTTTTKPTFPGKIVKETNYKYYSTHVDSNAAHFKSLWKDLDSLSDSKRHETLSESHRVAATIDLQFPFRFYGHTIKNVTVATGGFLYMSPFLHRFLTATQYIAPLMANFDAGISSSSHIYYRSTTQFLVVEWSNIFLQDQRDLGSFTFQVTLQKDSSVIFLYKKLPVDLGKIRDTAHPVKIGLSDAYYVNVDSSLPKLGDTTPTIFEYDNIQINKSSLHSGFVVTIRPKQTCNMDQTCTKCLKERENFDCRWCGATSKCSDGFDWHRHEWLLNRCHDKARTTDCPAASVNTTTTTTKSNPTTPRHITTTTTTLKPTTTLTPTTPKRTTPKLTTPLTPKPTTKTATMKPTMTTTPTTKPMKTTHPTTTKPITTKPIPKTSTTEKTTTKLRTTKPTTTTTTRHTPTTSVPLVVAAQLSPKQYTGTGMAPWAVAVLVLIMLACVVGLIGGWLYYAYTHPTSRSGLWLISHRPSQMKDTLSKMKFWKRGPTGEERYGMETTA